MGLFNSLSALIGKKEGRLEQAWEFSSKEGILAPPAIADLEKTGKLIIFGTKNGNVYAVDDMGRTKWVFSPEEKRDAVTEFFSSETAKAINCTPLIAEIDNEKGKKIAVGSEEGMIYVLGSDGKLAWKYKCNDAVRHIISHDINNDKRPEMLFGSKDGNFYAFSGKNVLWKFKADSPIESCPAVMSDDKGIQIIFGSNSGTVYSIDKKGKVLWSFKTQGKVTAAPAIGKIFGGSEEFIVIGSHDNSLYALDGKGNLRWKYQTEGSIVSKAAIADVNKDRKIEIAFGSCDDNVYLLSGEGTLIWRYETDFWVVSSPVAFDLDGDNEFEIIAGSYDKSLYILDSQGALSLKYMPGISGITSQTGNYNEIMNSAPANLIGKVIWRYQAKEIIIGAQLLDTNKKSIILATENGLCSLYINKNG